MTLKIIGMIGIICCVAWFALFWKKKPGKPILFSVLAALAVFVVVLFLPPANRVEPPYAEPSSTPAASASSASGSGITAKPYQTELIGGFYTPGIDFPAGRYNLTVLEGTGQVYHTSPTGGGKAESLSITGTRQLNGLELSLGEALSVTGLKIRIESSAADASALSGRENTATKTVTLGAGTYRVGENLEDGVYDIAAISGKVKFDSDSEGSVCHETLNAQGKDFEKEFKNLLLDVGTAITISGGSVRLVPSK